MVIWSAEITCKLGSLSWVTLRNFKIANRLWTKEKDRISLTPAEHMLLIFLHSVWVLELCASWGCNGAITELLLTAEVCIPGLNTAVMWGGDISILLLSESGSKGENMAAGYQHYTFLQHSFYEHVANIEEVPAYLSGPDRSVWGSVSLHLLRALQKLWSASLCSPSNLLKSPTNKVLGVYDDRHLMEETSHVVWNWPHQLLCISKSSRWAGTKVMGQLHTVLILECLRDN